MVIAFGGEKKVLCEENFFFVWRSGRDSNSRPHAWQACILTKLNYRTKPSFQTCFLSRKRVQKYEHFWNRQNFFLSRTRNLELYIELQYITSKTFLWCTALNMYKKEPQRPPIPLFWELSASKVICTNKRKRETVTSLSFRVGGGVRTHDLQIHNLAL